MVHDAKYGDNPCTAQELCFRVMQQSAAAGQQFLSSFKADGAASGAASVGAAPNGGAPSTQAGNRAPERCRGCRRTWRRVPFADRG